MKIIFSSLLLFLCTIILLCSCKSDNPKEIAQSETYIWMNRKGNLKVLSTTGMIHDLVKQIGDIHVDSLVLIKGELDPHSYQLVKGDNEKLLAADLIFYNGLGLEHGPSLQNYLQTNSKAIPLGNLIGKQAPSLILYVNGQPDPHIWMDISLWAKAIPHIVEALVKEDPRHTYEYRGNGERLTQKLMNLHHDIKQRMHNIPNHKRYLVTSHDAFNYFTRQYLAAEDETLPEQWNKRFQAPEGLAPDSQLSTADIQFILDHVKKYDIHVLFPESNVSRDSIRKILSAGKEYGLNLSLSNEPLYGDAMGGEETDGNTYIKMMQHNARVIEDKLKSH